MDWLMWIILMVVIALVMTGVLFVVQRQRRRGGVMVRDTGQESERTVR
jgi:hypothetical protein